MARRRMIDPNFWRSQDVKKLTIRQRLLAIGLFSLADDDGRGIADPPYVRSMVFPYDDFSSKEISGDLKAIGQHLSITFYEVNDNKFYAWRKWEKWQTVNRPQNSVLPPPPDEIKQAKIESNSGDSENYKEEKGEEEKKEELTNNLSSNSLPDSFPDSFFDSLPDVTQTERQILAELKAVPNYPFDFTRDLDHIRNLAVDFPTLDLLAEVKKWRTYKSDKPLTPKSNARLQFRVWCEKAIEFRREGEKVNGKHNQSDGKTSGETKIDFSRFFWKSGEDDDDEE